MATHHVITPTWNNTTEPMAEKGGSSRAREAIQTLSSVLSGLGVPKVPSEVFRQAKFNQSSSHSAMLQLLYKLISILNLIISAENKIRCNLPTTEQIMASVVKDMPDNNWMLLIVQRFMYRLGYSRTQFYSTSLTDGQSRELLLALGWVILEIKLIDKIKECIIQSARTPLYKPANSSLLAILQLECTNTTIELVTITKALQCNDYDQDILQKLTYVNGRLSKQLKLLDKLFVTYKRLEHKISSLHSNEKMFGVFEYYLLTHPEYYTSYVKRLEMHVSLLKLFLYWEELEQSFSKWIESVIELDDQQQYDIKSLNDNIGELCTEISCAVSNKRNCFELVSKMKIPPSHQYTIQEIVNRDMFLIAMESFKQVGVDSEILKGHVCLLEDHIITNKDFVLLKKEVERKQTIVLQEMKHFKEIQLM